MIVTAVSGNTIRVTLMPKGANSAELNLSNSPVLISRHWPEPALKLSEVGRARSLKIGEWRVQVASAPLAIDVFNRTGKLLQRLVFDERKGDVSFRLGDAPLFGLGGGGPQFDKRGTFDAMNNGHRAGEFQIFGSRVPVPLLLSPEGWGLFFHRPYRGVFDLRGAEGRFEARAGTENPRETALPLDVFVMLADSPPGLLAEYTSLTGKPALPPKWAFGYMQSHRTLAGPEEVLQIAETFRKKELPCDALIYLGTGYTPSGWNTGHGSLEFNPKVFDQPTNIIARLHEEHFKVILHVNNAPRALHGELPPLPDEQTGPAQLATYWARHETLLPLGIDGWWPDDGDELPIESRLARHRMYYNGSLRDRPNQRPFALHRTGYAGMQRYGDFVWSGDVYSLWNTLAAHVPVGLNFSVSATPFWGSDTGGFTPTRELTGELYVRWFQFSSFTPSFRSHGRVWHTRLPWGWNTGEASPNEVVPGSEGSAAPEEKELHNAEVEPICRRYLNLRYQLMPYLYTAARETHDAGMPLMRPLWLHYSDDPKAVARGDEYLWGRNILVAPVVEKGATQRKLYVPRGEWFDFWSRTPVQGGQEITRYVNLGILPLYVRAGTILPLDPPRQYTDEPTDKPMTLNVYPGADGEFVLYEDDGSSLDYTQDIAAWTHIRWNDRARTLTIEADAKSKMKPAASRKFDVLLVPGGARKSVDYDGGRIEVKF